MTQSGLASLEGPTLAPGLTVLSRPSARSAALQQLVVGQLDGPRTRTLWVDARNNASSYALYDHASSNRVLDGIRVARAFTAYQHHSLVRRLVERAGSETDLVVVPCTASLYQDDDVPDHVAAGLLDASLALLGEIASTYEIPVVVTTPATDSGLHGHVVDAADRTLAARQTSQGLRFDGDDTETTVYYHDGYFQTTIPYWVDLCGCVCEGLGVATPHQSPLPALEG
jgi:hypothetical protein